MTNHTESQASHAAHAYLSPTAADRLRAVLSATHRVTLSALAETEARRILDATEPTAYADWRTVRLGIHCLSGAGRTDGRGATIDAWGGVRALASALATFTQAEAIRGE